MFKKIAGALGALALLGSSALAQSQTPPDAQRFIDPVSAYSATISPDGNYIAYIARNDNAQQVIMVVDVAQQTARPIQAMDANVGSFNWVDWKTNDRLIVGASVHRSYGGRAATGTLVRSEVVEYDIERVVAVNRDGTGVMQMFEGQLNQLYYGYGSTVLLDLLSNDPSHVLLGAWDNSGAGIWRADITSGHAERVLNGSTNTYRYLTDGNGVAVIREDVIPDGSGYRIYRRAPGDNDWTFVREARRAATATNSPDFQLVGPGPGAAQVYVMSRPENSDLLRMYLFNTATGELSAPLEQGATSDVAGAWFSRRTHDVVATCDFGQRYQCRAVDPAMQRNLRAVDRFFEGRANVTLADMSDDGGRWLLQVDSPTLPGGFYLYDLTAHSVVPVATQYPSVDTNALSPTEVVSYTARDGTELWAYVTARPGVTGPRPTVMMPHGGPEARDEYGYDAFAQFLASRGYVVVQPNFRGGSGFGRAFADAGRGQWGLRMQDDVTDAVNHLVQTGVTDAQRICIVGASYGGYVALQGVASTPDLYKCAVSISGDSDLLDKLRGEGVDGHQLRNYQYWLRSIGDPNANRTALEAASPRRHADRITAPVLLIHGEDDDNVPIRQSQLMQEALNNAGHRTRLVRIPDEGHYWDEWSNEHRLTLYRETEAFLAQNLGPAH